MISWLSILLRLVLIGFIVFQLLLVVRLPTLVYQRSLPAWRRLGYSAGIAVALRRLAGNAVGRGDLATALQLSREVVHARLGRLPPDLPTQLLILGQTLSRSGRTEAAIQWFRVADDCTGADFRSKPAILIALGLSLASAGRYEEAESALARASELYVESAHPEFHGGELQRWDMRTPKYRRRVANAHGYVAMLSGRFEDARTWYEAAQALPGAQSRNDRMASLNNLAAAGVELGELDRAERYVNQARTLAGADAWPGQDYFVGTRGALRLAQGRLAEARADFIRVLTLRGDDPRTLLYLAQLAQKEGTLEEAIGYIERIRVPPREALWRRRLAETLEGLAESDQLAGRPEAAEKRRAEATQLRVEVPP